MLRLYSILILCQMLSFTAFSQADAGGYFKEGFQLFTDGQYDAAIKNYNLAIGLDPSKSYYYFHRANALQAKGNKELALKDYSKSNELKPNAESYYQIGLIKYDRRDSIGALASFEQVRTIRDNFEKLYYYLGVLYFRTNRIDSSVSCLNRYTSSVKTNGDAYYYLALNKVKQNQYEEATGFLNKVLMYNNNDWHGYFKLYEVYMLMNNKEKALYNISMVIELGQTKSSYYLIRAELYDALGYSEKAKEDRAFASSTVIK